MQSRIAKKGRTAFEVDEVSSAGRHLIESFKKTPVAGFPWFLAVDPCSKADRTIDPTVTGTRLAFRNECLSHQPLDWYRGVENGAKSVVRSMGSVESSAGLAAGLAGIATVCSTLGRWVASGSEPPCGVRPGHDPTRSRTDRPLSSARNGTSNCRHPLSGRSGLARLEG